MTARSIIWADGSTTTPDDSGRERRPLSSTIYSTLGETYTAADSADYLRTLGIG